VVACATAISSLNVKANGDINDASDAGRTSALQYICRSFLGGPSALSAGTPDELAEKNRQLGQEGKGAGIYQKRSRDAAAAAFTQQ
jgi:hypothetical protein